jgi:aminoglycoside phosphotransferase (APT) family kinase protein
MAIDTDALRAWLQARTGSGRVSLDIKRLGGGAIQENHALDVAIGDGEFRGTHHWVLRTDAASGVRVSHSREQEFHLLSAAFEAGVTVPEPLWLCTDTAIIDRPFYIMTRVPGSADARRLVQAEWTADERREIVNALGRELATLHGIDTGLPDLSFLPRPEGPPAAHRVREYRVHLDALPEPQPVLEWGLRWLELNAPAREDTVLCHCDFRTGNIMIDDGRVTGILDWEFAALSSPIEDLGWYCARCWRFGADRYEAGGIGEREDFVQAYEQAAGRRVDREALDYWQIMAEVRWGVIALQQAERHTSGREPSLELALTGYMVPEMELNLIHAIDRTGHGHR